MPITVKDSFETADLVTACTAPRLRDHRTDSDSVAVECLTEAGAIALGKTNVPLFVSDWQSYNAVYGLSRNPGDPELTVGGSSGGAAAALAAGLVPLEIGSDIAGPTRIPAHFCGVYGHKSSHGIIPLRGHIPGPPGALAAPDLMVADPMARTPQDWAAAGVVATKVAASDATTTTPQRRITLAALSSMRTNPHITEPDTARAQQSRRPRPLRRRPVAIFRSLPGVAGATADLDLGIPGEVAAPVALRVGSLMMPLMRDCS